MPKEEFILVPKSVNDITTEWCNEVLHNSKCMSHGTNVSDIKVKNLTGDGEGLSGAQMFRLELTYRYLFIFHNSIGYVTNNSLSLKWRY